MPTYSYFCENCNLTFEHFFSIRNYIEETPCEICQKTCKRDYATDLPTQFSSVKKSDNELKTIGDLANRNRDRLSEDAKTALDKKHNEYKDKELAKELPKGMSRIKKPNKVKWR